MWIIRGLRNSGNNDNNVPAPAPAPAPAPTPTPAPIPIPIPTPVDTLTVSIIPPPTKVAVGVQMTLHAVASGGTAPYTYVWNNLPIGCANANTPNLTCTPSTIGSYNTTVTVIDTDGMTATSAAITLVVPGFTVFHSFNGNSATDGAQPNATLIQAPDSDFYGTTAFGGAQGAGTVFKIDPQGVFSLLHSFDNNSVTDGVQPMAALIQTPDGNFYGTTANGGAYGSGIVFKLVVG